MAVFSCDLETSGLDPKLDAILGMGYYNSQEQGYLTDLGEIKAWLLAHTGDKLIWQNGKFDQKFIYYKTGHWPQNSFDTLLGAYVLPQKPPKLGLGSLAEFYLGVPSYKDTSFITNLAAYSIEDQSRYCLEDCRTTFQVAKEELPLLTKTGNTEFYNKWLLPASDLLAEVELRGVRINKPLLEKMWEEATREISNYEEKLYKEYEEVVKQYEIGLIWKDNEKKKTILTNEQIEVLRKKPKFKFNFTSAKQKLWLLRDQFGLPCTVTKYERGRKVQKYSVGIKVIEDYLGKHPIIGKLIDLNDLLTVEKQAHQLLEFYRPDGRVYTTFTLHVTDTGRLSATSPNLQNISKAFEVEAA